MNRLSSLIIALALLLSQLAPVFAQQQQQPASNNTATPQQEDAYDDEVVRITTNLVQVDAVVTDKDGRYVTDLRPEDFEISEDGKRQQVTNFSYVAVAADTPAKPAPDSRRGKSAVMVPPARLSAEQVRRTIALVVDDLCLSLESIGGVRKALNKYVDEQMQPGDLVAVMRTSAGLGALQQFTADKRVLHAAIEHIRWYPGGRCGSNTLQQITPLDTLAKDVASSGDSADAEENVRSTTSGAEALNQYRSDVFTVGTIGAVNYVVGGLRELPGRKAVVLFSDGFKLINFEAVIAGKDRTDTGDQLRESLRRLIDRANRSSVVIYTMDARGLQALMSAGDSTMDPLGTRSGTNSPGAYVQRSGQIISERNRDLFETQDGLSYLARETGGIFIRNTNDLAGGMRRVMEDQKGYYLIGYRPDETTFDARTGRRRFHDLKVRVKRPGLTVRSRTGFFGIAESEARQASRTPGQQLTAALVSPFNASAVDLRMTSLFGNDRAVGSYMRSLVFVNARDLKFTEEKDGWRKATLDFAAVTFDGEGRPIEQVNETREVRVSPEGYQRILESGLTYSLSVPVKKPGAYQLRVAVRDAGSEKTGSASQFVSVPDLLKGRIALSGIALAGIDPSVSTAAPGSVQAMMAEPDPQFGPAVRRLKQGMMLDYGYIIYNARIDRKTIRPQLTAQVRLYRDGQLVFTGRETPVDVSQQSDLERITTGGRFQVGAEMPPGNYVLQVVVTDLLDKSKQRTVTQWTDFEIVK